MLVIESGKADFNYQYIKGKLLKIVTNYWSFFLKFRNKLPKLSVLETNP